MYDNQDIVPLRQSAADRIIAEHIINNGLTGVYLPSVNFTVENAAAQADQQQYLTSTVGPLIVYGILGLTFQAAVGSTYAGRYIPVDSTNIEDLSQTDAVGADFLQLDASIVIMDQDGVYITDRAHGLPGPILSARAAFMPIMFRDPCIIPYNRQMELTMKFHRNPGTAGTARLQFIATRLTKKQ